MNMSDMHSLGSNHKKPLDKSITNVLPRPALPCPAGQGRAGCKIFRVPIF
jgi:hypothetical protein